MDGTRLRTWFLATWTTIGLLLLLAGAWWVIREPFGIIFAPLAFAAIIVYLLNPVVRWLHARRIPRGLGATFAYLVFLGALIAIGAVVGPLLADQVGEFGDDFPDIATDLQNTINSQLDRVGVDYEVNFDLRSDEVQESLREFFTRNREQLTELLKGAGSVLGAVFHVLLTLILAPILAFYLLVDLPKLNDSFRRFLPPGRRGEFFEVTERIGVTVGAYFRGMLFVAAFVAVGTSIGLAIIGLPFWALVGAVSGLFNLIPLIGPFVGGVIGVVLALTVGDGFGQALAVVIVMTVVQQIDNHLITPNIMSRTVKLHPVTVMLGLLVAGSMYGILGMLVVIPIIATAKLVALHVLVTRVPAMSHLAAREGPGLFDDPGVDEDASPDVPDATAAPERPMRAPQARDERADTRGEEPSP